MKKEIKCPRCRRRIQKEDAYCQYCGCHVAEEKKKKRKKKIRRFLEIDRKELDNIIDGKTISYDEMGDR